MSSSASRASPAPTEDNLESAHQAVSSTTTTTMAVRGSPPAKPTAPPPASTDDGALSSLSTFSTISSSFSSSFSKVDFSAVGFDGPPANDFQCGKKALTAITPMPRFGMLATASLDGYVRVFSFYRGQSQLHRVFPLSGRPRDRLLCASHPQAFKGAALLATGSTSGNVKVYDVSNAAKPPTNLHHAHAVNSVSFSLSGDHLVTGTVAGALRRWDLVTEQRIEKAVLGLGEVTCVKTWPNHGSGGNVVLAGYTTQRAYLHDFRLPESKCLAISTIVGVRSAAWLDEYHAVLGSDALEIASLHMPGESIAQVSVKNKVKYPPKASAWRGSIVDMTYSARTKHFLAAAGPTGLWQCQINDTRSFGVLERVGITGDKSAPVKNVSAVAHWEYSQDFVFDNLSSDKKTDIDSWSSALYSDYYGGVIAHHCVVSLDEEKRKDQEEKFAEARGKAATKAIPPPDPVEFKNNDKAREALENLVKDALHGIFHYGSGTSSEIGDKQASAKARIAAWVHGLSRSMDMSDTLCQFVKEPGEGTDKDKNYFSDNRHMFLRKKDGAESKDDPWRSRDWQGDHNHGLKEKHYRNVEAIDGEKVELISCDELKNRFITTVLRHVKEKKSKINDYEEYFSNAIVPVFHCAKPHVYELLAEDGFNSQYNKTGWFGRGHYFSRDPLYPLKNFSYRVHELHEKSDGTKETRVGELAVRKNKESLLRFWKEDWKEKDGKENDGKEKDASGKPACQPVCQHVYHFDNWNPVELVHGKGSKKSIVKSKQSRFSRKPQRTYFESEKELQWAQPYRQIMLCLVYVGSDDDQAIVGRVTTQDQSCSQVTCSVPHIAHLTRNMHEVCIPTHGFDVEGGDKNADYKILPLAKIKFHYPALGKMSTEYY